MSAWAWACHSALLVEKLHERKNATIHMAMVERGVRNDPALLEWIYQGELMARHVYPDGVEVYLLAGVPLVKFGPPTIEWLDDGQVRAYQDTFLYLR